VLRPLPSQTGVYQFKVDMKGLKATPFGDDPCMEGVEGVDSADSMSALEMALYDVCKEKSKFPAFSYQCDMVTPGVALWTACIGTQKIGGGGGGGGAVATRPATADVAATSADSGRAE